jgi:hypothetical protein
LLVTLHQLLFFVMLERDTPKVAEYLLLKLFNLQLEEQLPLLVMARLALLALQPPSPLGLMTMLLQLLLTLN